MPRVLLTVSLIVCRVPNETSAESVALIRSAEIARMAAWRAGSLWSPMVISDVESGPTCCCGGRGAHVMQMAATSARDAERSSTRCMLFYLDEDGFDG